MFATSNTKREAIRMKTAKNKLFAFYFLGDGVIILFALFMGGEWRINTQLAFICSLLITFATFRSYSMLVQSRLENGMIPADKYEVYYKDSKDDEEDEDDIVEEKKPEAKIEVKQGFQNLALSYKSALSLYRIVAYGILFIVLLYLIRHDKLNAFAFFVGLSVVPFTSLISAFILRRGFNETNE